MAKRRPGTTIAPTPPPRGPALIKRHIAIGALGAGAVGAALVLSGCSGTAVGTGDPNDNDPPPQAPQPPELGPQPSPPVLPPQPPVQPPQPPQPYDGGSSDGGGTDGGAFDGPASA
jgi:hypothetical protein